MKAIKRHETAILNIALGVCFAGFVAAINWDALGRSVGLL